MKTSLVRGSEGNEGDAPQGMKLTLHSIQRTTRRHWGGTVFSIRHTCPRIKVGVLPKKTRKGCIMKDFTRLFWSDGLKTFGAIWRCILLHYGMVLWKKKCWFAESFLLSKTLSQCNRQVYNLDLTIILFNLLTLSDVSLSSVNMRHSRTIFAWCPPQLLRHGSDYISGEVHAEMINALQAEDAVPSGV